jgi:hypothetical protein
MAALVADSMGECFLNNTLTNQSTPAPTFLQKQLTY